MLTYANWGLILKAASKAPGTIGGYLQQEKHAYRDLPDAVVASVCSESLVAYVSLNLES